jgi:hypothetical protein
MQEPWEANQLFFVTKRYRFRNATNDEIDQLACSQTKLYKINTCTFSFRINVILPNYERLGANTEEPLYATRCKKGGVHCAKKDPTSGFFQNNIKIYSINHRFAIIIIEGSTTASTVIHDSTINVAKVDVCIHHMSQIFNHSPKDLFKSPPVGRCTFDTIELAICVQESSRYRYTQ